MAVSARALMSRLPSPANIRFPIASGSISIIALEVVGKVYGLQTPCNSHPLPSTEASVLMRPTSLQLGCGPSQGFTRTISTSSGPTVLSGSGSAIRGGPPVKIPRLAMTIEPMERFWKKVAPSVWIPPSRK